MFSKVGGQSSALHYAENELNVLLDKVHDVSLSFYLDVGTYEPRFIPANRRFVSRLQQKGWPCRYQEVAGAHNWTTWRSHLKDLLISLWGTVH
jgi:enterochelin esterase-like enzyme